MPCGPYNPQVLDKIIIRLLITIKWPLKVFHAYMQLAKRSICRGHASKKNVVKKLDRIDLSSSNRK